MDSVRDNSANTLAAAHPITTVVVDDEPEIRKGIEALFATSDLIELVAMGVSGEDAVELTLKYRPQVLLLDLHFPDGMDGIQTIHTIRSMPEIQTKILVYSWDVDEYAIFEAIKAGAASYTWKQESDTNLIEALLTTARGGAYISPGMADRVLELFSKDDISD